MTQNSQNQNSTQSNSTNEQPKTKKPNLEDLANISKILVNMISIIFTFWRMLFDN